MVLQNKAHSTSVYIKISMVTESKYLGVTIESNLKFHIHIRSIANKANKTLGVPKRNLQSSSEKN